MLYPRSSGNKHVFCANCGEYGHVYRICNAPISSFGIICYRMHPSEKKIEYLLVQRNDSLSYVEFIRGKYNIQNRNYIKRLVSNMTVDERARLTQHSFVDLWQMFWQPDIDGGNSGNSSRRNRSHQNSKEFMYSQTRFNMLKDGYYLRNSEADTEYFNLEIALNQTSSEFTDTEIGFPKGRRNINETDMNCAFREFTEETNVDIHDIGIVDYKRFEEVFLGSNNTWYRHVYYIAELAESSEHMQTPSNVLVPARNPTQMREIKATMWKSFEDALSCIREVQKERRELFVKAHDFITNRYTSTFRAARPA